MVHRTFLKPHKKTPLADRTLSTEVAAHTLTRNEANKDTKFILLKKKGVFQWLGIISLTIGLLRYKLNADIK